MKKLLYIIAFILPTLACGVTTGASVRFPIHNPAPAPSDQAVRMMVTVDEGLYIRQAAGEKSPLVDGKHILTDSEIVTCYQFKIIGDSFWCHHERGWSNARWLRVVKLEEKE